MKFSTKTRYALRLMLDLAALDGEEYVSLRDIAARQEISAKYLEQIVRQLARAGLLHSSRGWQGGYRLARTPSEITPGDVVRAIEGKLAVVACLEDQPNACPRAAACPTLDFWDGLRRTMNAYLDGTTLKEMAEKNHPA